jgi:hypothetical protein
MHIWIDKKMSFGIKMLMYEYELISISQKVVRNTTFVFHL